MLDLKFEREDGLNLGITSAIIDSGAYQDHVLRFTKPRFSRNVIAGKGENQPGKPVLSMLSRGNKLKAPVYRIGTDTAKGIIMARLKQTEFGPGYMHFTDAPEAMFDENYFSMLTAEAASTEFKKGFAHRVWIKTRPRNEALDCRVMNLAALYHLNPNWRKVENSLVKRLDKVKVQSSETVTTENEQTTTPEQPAEPQEKPIRRPVMRRGFAHSWRRF
jgi:phage terminase large subunit GpA-like protein